MKNKLLITTALAAVIVSNTSFADENYIYAYAGKTTTIASGTIIQNKENDIGGAATVSKYYKSNSNITPAAKLEIEENVQFLNNKATYDGGAIGNYGGAVIAQNVDFIGNEAQLETTDSNPIGGGAISLGVDAQLTVAGSKFEGNISGYDGGAIATRRTLQKSETEKGIGYDENGERLSDYSNFIHISNSQFIENKATGITSDTGNGQKPGGNGGAIASNFATLTIENTTFEGNEAKNYGGAVYNHPFIETDGSTAQRNDEVQGGDVNIASSVFTNNKATFGGAVFNATEANANISGETSFTGNQASNAGGAIYNAGTIDSLDGITFAENSSENVGGAISNKGTINSIANSVFTGNTSKNGGAAIYTNNGELNIGSGTVFENNASENGNAGAIFVGQLANVNVDGASFTANTANYGGAISSAGNLSIANSTFSDNEAQTGGGAINVNAKSVLTLSGDNTFSGNKTNGALNDIENAGTLDIAEGAVLTLDGGITGEGTANFGADTTLNVKHGVTTITNAVTSEGTTLNVTLASGATSLDLNDIFTNENNKDSLDNIKLSDNTLYNLLAVDGDVSLYQVEAKSSDEVASSLGLTNSTTTALLAAVSNAETDNENFNTVANALNDAAQAGNAVAAQEASKLGADMNPIIRTRETALANMVFAAVTDVLNDNAKTIAQTSSSEDIYHKATAWVKGLFNKLDHEKTSKASGFNGDTYGIAFGIDKELDNHIRAGVGYAYSESDIDSASRKTDIDTNTLFVYGKYQPENWYINTVVAYSWSDYDEKKSVLGYNANTKYDVNTWAIQSMYGYETNYNTLDITPEIGIRYLHIEQKGYKDKLGTRIVSNDSDILTAVIGTKIAKSYELNNNQVLRPELKVAATYDLVEDGNNANILLANGAAYRINGEKLDRLGLELGVKVTVETFSNWDLSAGYEARIREDYHDNTWMLEAKYSF